MDTILRDKKGITLIELMVALMVSTLLIAALYGTFLSQQRTFTGQEQTVEMQQNVRVGVNRMIREIRMAGFGNVSNVLPVNGFNQVLTMNPSSITIVGAFEQIKDGAGNPTTVAAINGDKITLSSETTEFDGAANAYVCIGGLTSYVVEGRQANVLTLDRAPQTSAIGANVFKIQAITYTLTGGGDLQRDEHTGIGPETLAARIENIQFQYLDADGNPTAQAALVRMIRLTLGAKTERSDPEFKEGDGYRRRVISSNIHVRNLGLTL